ncbi:RNA recognition motif 2-domain-containing protein [Phyllosticta capitalensis]
MTKVPCGFEPIGGARLSERFSTENGKSRYALVRLSDVWEHVPEHSLAPVLEKTPYAKAQYVKLTDRSIAFKFDSLKDAERAVKHPNPAIARETLDLLGPSEFMKATEWVRLAGASEPRHFVHPLEGQVVLEVTTSERLTSNAVAQSYYAALEFLDENLGRNQVRALIRLQDAADTIFTNEFGSGFRFRLEVDLLRVAAELKTDHRGTRIGRGMWSMTVVDYTQPGVEPVQNTALMALVPRPRQSTTALTPRRGGRNADDAANAINLRNIRDGVDVRTTVMVRNIPNKMDTHGLHDILQKLAFGRFDFVYLRIDFRNGFNVGYAFVNFSTAIDIVSFHERLVAHGWPRDFGSGKSPAMSYATVQGPEALVEKFRNSSVMLETFDYRPRLFHTRESATRTASQTNRKFMPRVGDELAFPGPNNEAKLQRSRQNAETQGLWAAHTREDQRRARHTIYDRGNPNAIAMLPPAASSTALTVRPGGYDMPSARYSSATTMQSAIMTPPSTSFNTDGFQSMPFTPFSSFQSVQPTSNNQLVRYGGQFQGSPANHGNRFGGRRS